MKEKLTLLKCVDSRTDEIWVPVKNIVTVSSNMFKEDRLIISFVGDDSVREYVTCDLIDAQKVMEFL
jgi:hypothetical protein